MRRNSTVVIRQARRSAAPGLALRVEVVWSGAAPEEDRRLLREVTRILLDAARRRQR